MSVEIICAIVACVGSLSGSLAGVLVSNNKTMYRIEQLEKKVDAYNDAHNSVIERVYKLEQCEAVIDEKIAVANHRIEDLENTAK